MDKLFSHYIGTPFFPGCKGQGLIKSKAEDFLVEECLSFEPEGNGEHIYLYIEKCNMNTVYIARNLAKVASVKERHVSYSGRKDRYALTRQWFSVWMPSKNDPDWHSLTNYCKDNEYLKILNITRHKKKLRPGTHQKNFFRIIVREISADQCHVDQQIEKIKKQGIANYFGKQRFGHDTLKKIKDRSSRHLSYFDYSVIRSFLFNTILNARAEQNVIAQYIPGDIIQLDGSHSIFVPESWNSTLQKRLETADIHLTAPLWGINGIRSTSEALALEQKAIAEYQNLLELIEASDVVMSRRPLRIIPREIRWQWLQSNQLEISFYLPPGSFATSLLQALFEIKEPEHFPVN